MAVKIQLKPAQEQNGGGSDGRGADGKDGKDGQSNVQPVINAPGGTKEKNTIRESITKTEREHQHTATKETQQMLGQNPTVQTAATKNIGGGTAPTTAMSDMGNFRKK